MFDPSDSLYPAWIGIIRVALLNERPDLDMPDASYGVAFTLTVKLFTMVVILLNMWGVTHLSGGT